MTRLVWTEDKLKNHGQSVINKLLMLLQIHGNTENWDLKIVIRGDESRSLLQTVLSQVAEDVLVPLSMLTNSLDISHTHYYSQEQGRVRNGTSTLREYLRLEINARAKLDFNFAVRYTKCCLHKGESYSFFNSISKDKLPEAMKELFQYAIDNSSKFLVSLVSSTNPSSMISNLPKEMIVTITDMLLKCMSDPTFEEVYISRYTIDDLLSYLLDEKLPLPEGTTAYALKNINDKLRDEPILKHVMNQLIEVLRANDLDSKIGVGNPNVEVVK